MSLSRARNFDHNFGEKLDLKLCRRISRSTCSASIAVIAGLCNLAYAEDDRYGLEEVVVTAEKKVSTIQETPVTINAFDQEALTNLGATDIVGLSDAVPGLHIGQFGSDINVGLRGINSFEGGARGDASVALHVDGVYLSRPYAFGAAFFDLERVEVLSGPQGTLYGRNATGGLINLISNKPKDEFEASINVGLGNYSQISTETVINLPVSDQLALRGAFYSNEHDGYRDNVLVADGDDADDLALRLSMLYTPTDNLTILVAGDYSTKEGVGGVARSEFAGGDREEWAMDYEGFRDDDFWGIRLEATWDLDSATLTYLGSYRENDVIFSVDGDASAFNSGYYTFPSHNEETSHELRLASASEDALQWMFGIYYFEEEQESDSVATVVPANFYITWLYTDEAGGGYYADSTAVFGQLSYEISNNFVVHAGLRNTTDSKERIGIVEFRALPISGPLLFPGSLRIAEDEWNKTTWKVGLDWHVAEDSMIYFSASTGYKAGGYNDGVNTPTYDPEEILAFELGTKNRFFDNRWQVNGALFLYDYVDLQIAQQEGNGTPVRNAGKADIFGAELSVLGMLSDNDLVELNIGYLDTEYEDTFFPEGGITYDVSGNSLMKAPEWSVNWAYAHDWNLTNGSVLTGRIQSSYRSKVHLNIFNRPEDGQDAITNTDLVLTYKSSDERWYVQGFVRNLEDESARQSFGLNPDGSTLASYGPPRTYGVKFGYSWE